MPKRNSRKLTDTFINKSLGLPVSGRTEHFDSQEDNLCLRISSTGNKSWCVYYRLGGTNRKITIGSYPTYSIAEAREEAAQIKKLVATGVDPVAARKSERAERAAATKLSGEPLPDSVETMAALFMKRYVTKNVRQATARDYERHFRLDILPMWQGQSVRTISRSDIAILLDRVEDRAAIQCNRVRATLSKWFNWMVERGVIDANPVLSTKPRTREVPRTRSLSCEELKSIWMGAEHKGWPFGPLIQLLLLTGKRRGEVAGMRWSEIDLQSRTWTINPERSGTKQRRHSKKPPIHDVVPLSRQAVEVIKQLPQFGDEDLVFPARNRSGNSVSGFSKANQQISNFCGVEDWRLHDLRRTVRTNLSALQIRKEVADKILNHTDGTAGGLHYDQHDYLEEKREALQGWADHLYNVVKNSKS